MVICGGWQPLLLSYDKDIFTAEKCAELSFNLEVDYNKLGSDLYTAVWGPKINSAPLNLDMYLKSTATTVASCLFILGY